MAGITLISSVDLFGDNDELRGSFPHKTKGEIAIGDILAVASAILYGIYIIFMKKRIGNEERVSMPLFFSYVGIFNMLFLWPGFFLLHFTKIETFQLPQTRRILAIVLVCRKRFELTGLGLMTVVGQRCDIFCFRVLLGLCHATNFATNRHCRDKLDHTSFPYRPNDYQRAVFFTCVLGRRPHRFPILCFHQWREHKPYSKPRRSTCRWSGESYTRRLTNGDTRTGGVCHCSWTVGVIIHFRGISTCCLVSTVPPEEHDRSFLR